MNDYRGVLSAYQYGDSYLVLILDAWGHADVFFLLDTGVVQRHQRKDVRLRTTFAATDSGGIAGHSLAVLDKYAHVLQEYDDRELRELVEVALANTSLTDVGVSQPRLLRGMSSDCAAEWITVGFPDLPQKKGRYYFEVELLRGCRSAQVGFLSNQFIIAPKTVLRDLFIETGQMLYPAVSLKGRASFNFGPEFKHPAPKFKGFAAWPGMPDGKVRADVPIIGDENNVGIYKERRVSLKKNVQRLVANRKYLDRTKDSRSWAVIIDGLGVAEGTYGRTGVAIICCFVTLPRRSGRWCTKTNMMRSLLGQPWRSEGAIVLLPPAGMREIGLSDGECKALISALGKNSKVYRHQEKTNFVKETGEEERKSLLCPEAAHLSSQEAVGHLFI
eukprot:g15453.t1